MKATNEYTYLESIPEASHIMVAPLNWGLGHAARCIPIIEKLISKKHQVTLASDGLALDLLKKEFPKLNCIELPSYRIHYRWPFAIGMILQSPKLLYAIYREYQVTQDIVQKHHIDYIISDNRYGVRSSRSFNILLIHQINLILDNAILQWFGRRINTFLINRFEECWIPDTEDNILAGQLSNAISIRNARYIGILSRMHHSDIIPVRYDICIILSGPEPARSSLEICLIELFSNTRYKIKMVRGSSDRSSVTQHYGGIDIEDMATTQDINRMINMSRMVITRSGYTSLMDLYGLSKPVIMIPTPGQTEQVYLADRLQAPFYKISECELDKSLLDKVENLLKDQSA